MDERVPTTPILQVESLKAGYGRHEVLRGVNLTLHAGEVVAVIGDNGSGKTTLLRAIMGLVPMWSGVVRHRGEDIGLMPTWKRSRRGIAYVPQSGRVFRNLTVKENLRLVSNSACVAAFAHEHTWPWLKAPRSRQLAATLSAGEKQVLALTCGLGQRDTLVLLDEPTLGLARTFVDDLLDWVRPRERAADKAVLIVEQDLEVARKADRVYRCDHGSIIETPLHPEGTPHQGNGSASAGGTTST